MLMYRSKKRPSREVASICQLGGEVVNNKEVIDIRNFMHLLSDGDVDVDNPLFEWAIIPGIRIIFMQTIYKIA